MTAARRRFVPLDWSPIDPISSGVEAAGYQFIARSGRLYGWSFVEAGGSDPATLSLYDGSSNNGQLIAPVTLLANQSVSLIWGKPGIRVRNGVRMVVTSGTVQGVIYFLGMSDEEIAAQHGFEFTS